MAKDAKNQNSCSKCGIEKRLSVRLYNLSLKPQKDQKVRTFSHTKAAFKRLRVCACHRSPWLNQEHLGSLRSLSLSHLNKRPREKRDLFEKICGCGFCLAEWKAVNPCKTHIVPEDYLSRNPASLAEKGQRENKMKRWLDSPNSTCRKQGS